MLVTRLVSLAPTVPFASATLASLIIVAEKVVSIKTSDFVASSQVMQHLKCKCIIENTPGRGLVSIVAYKSIRYVLCCLIRSAHIFCIMYVIFFKVSDCILKDLTNEKGWACLYHGRRAVGNKFAVGTTVVVDVGARTEPQLRALLAHAVHDGKVVDILFQYLRLLL
jgi:hypothetical protein